MRILSDRERVVAALGDLVVNRHNAAGEEIDKEALQREIDEAFREQPPLSEIIIEERREDP